ncbi:ESPR-type extended signal peptide-containing protein, partial [Acinetobacter rathckeae]|uniref:ESPR-type extended signal peptide-containing protein n=1 Tax=Acinetobacter rathckeae TaxID=2605272 RepID=UPI00224BA3C5
MNKIYKIVWNAVLNSWVVVSELGKSKKKSARTLLAATSLITLTLSQATFAEVGTGGGTGSGTAISACTTTALQANSGTTAGSVSAANNIAIGCGTTTAGSQRSVAIGDSATTASDGNSQSVAIGSVAKASGDQSVALGNNVNATGNSSVAIGGDDINKVRRDSVMSTSYKTITGVNLPGGYPNTTASGGAATAIGVTAQATGNFSTAVGMASNATGDASLALGPTALASGTGSLALGPVSKATQAGSVAIGINSVSNGTNSTSIGSGSTADTGSQANGNYATAIGGSSKAATNATAIGTLAIAEEGGTAIGINSQATKAGGVAIGSDSVSTIDKGVSGYDPITGGASADTTGVWKSTNAAVAVGNGSTVTRQITGVAAGTNDQDAVNVAQLKLTKTYTDNVAKSTATALGGSSALDSTTGQVITPVYTITKTDGNQTQATGVEAAISALNTEVIKPISFASNSGSTTKKLGDTLTIKGTGTKTDDQYNTSNVKTTTDSDGNIVVGIDKNASFDTITTGNSVLSNTGLTITGGPSVTTSG